jgi:ADP-ribosylglycohydrolase
MSANRAPEAAADVFAPCRFRGVPSVAYRFALLAAGEADFALSHGGTNYWDFAGVHAILRSAGAELYNETGTAVRYPVDGRGRCGRSLFTAHPEFFQRYFQPGLLTSWKPVQPRPPRIRHIRESGLLCRGQGCLLGALTGGGGEPEMVLTLARALVEHGGFDAQRMQEAYQRWATTNAEDGGEPLPSALAGTAGAASAAGQSLARVASLAIFAAGGDPDHAASWAAQDAALMQSQPEIGASAAILADAMAYAIASGTSPFEVYRRALNTAAALGVPAEVFDALQRAEYEPPAASVEQWRIPATVQAAFHALLTQRGFTGPSAEQAIWRTRSNTPTAILGALAGAVFGREAIPLSTRRLLLTARDPRRPAWLWPADALTLAESLLAAGAGE